MKAFRIPSFVDILIPWAHITRFLILIASANQYWDSLPFPLPPYSMPSMTGFLMLYAGIFELVVGLLILRPKKESWWIALIMSVLAIVGFAIAILQFTVRWYFIPPVFFLLLIIGAVWFPSRFVILLLGVTCFELFILRDERIKRRYKIIE